MKSNKFQHVGVHCVHPGLLQHNYLKSYTSHPDRFDFDKAGEEVAKLAKDMGIAIASHTSRKEQQK